MISFYMTRKDCLELAQTSFTPTSLIHFCLLHNDNAHQTPSKCLFGCNLPYFGPFVSPFHENYQKKTRFRVVGFDIQNLRSVEGAHVAL